jgi:hypothetical protein
MLSSAMKAATSQTPYIAKSCVKSTVTAAEPSNHFDELTLTEIAALNAALVWSDGLQESLFLPVLP